MFGVVGELGNVVFEKTLQYFIRRSSFERLAGAIKTKNIEWFKLAHFGQAVVKWLGCKLYLLSVNDLTRQYDCFLKLYHFGDKFCELTFGHEVNVHEKDRTNSSLDIGHDLIILVVSKGKLEILNMKLEHLLRERVLTHTVKYLSNVWT